MLIIRFYSLYLMCNFSLWGLTMLCVEAKRFRVNEAEGSCSLMYMSQWEHDAVQWEGTMWS